MPKKIVLLTIVILIVAGSLIAYAIIRTQRTTDSSPAAEAGATAIPETNLGEDEVLRAFARCMRDHGLPAFPDPVEGGIDLLGSGIDQDSAEFQTAMGICESWLSQAEGAPQDEGSLYGSLAWQMITPEGDCQCADSSPFSFWVRHADPEKVVFYLDGGEACWDATTCAFTEYDSTTYQWKITGGDDPASLQGIFDLRNPENPLAEYSFVYVPYCTGDVHLGDVMHKYTPSLVVAHKGFINGTTALAYLSDNYPAAKQLVVIGLSAGSIASPVYAGLASDALPEAQIVVFADSSGAYPDNASINTEYQRLWGAFSQLPAWEVNEGLTEREWGFSRFWIQVGLHDPEMTLARFDYAFDKVQAEYINELGFPAANLIVAIEANEAMIEAAGVSQHSYTAPGEHHGIVKGHGFYLMEVNGVRLVGWVKALIAGEPLNDVHCGACTSE
jgi:hypothetical protein